MKIATSTLIADYNSLKQAALSGQSQAAILLQPANPAEIDLAHTHVDNDPNTQDELVASSWSGSFSDSGTRLDFQEGGGRLTFEQSHSDFIGAEPQTDRAVIDLASGKLLESSGQAEFIDGAAVAAPPAPPAANPGPGPGILADYKSLREAADRGEKEISVGVGQFTVEESRPGFLKGSSWDGDFSAQPSQVTYQEATQDGRPVLRYTSLTPASPFMIGSQDVTVSYTIDPATGKVL